MELSPLSAISPVDGRYRLQTAVLAPYFSEEALMKYRVRVEVEYFIALRQLPLPQLDSSSQQNVIALREVYTEFSQADAESIKRREAVTNHDVKALEYFLKDKWAERGLGQYKEFIHFGLTSQDINNTAFPLAIKAVSYTHLTLPTSDPV